MRLKPSAHAMPVTRKHAKPVIGWKEWLVLPDLNIPHIKAKVDTGAKTSALHAYDIEEFYRHGQLWVRFKVHPLQRNLKRVARAEARVIEHRHIRNSGGVLSFRPVIETVVYLDDYFWKIEVTLVDRSAMGFRMLLGRDAVKGRFLIDCSRDEVIGKGPRPKKRL